MKTIKDILTENRDFTIKVLQVEFKFQNVKIATLMADFLAFLEADTEMIALLNNARNPEVYIKNAITTYKGEVNYTQNHETAAEFDEKRRLEILKTI